MALGDAYAALDELKTRLGIPSADTEHDSELQAKLDGASREIESFCRRQFNDAGSPSPRVYYPGDGCIVEVDDFHEDAGLQVRTDDGGTGDFDTVWEPQDWQLEPLNGVVDGQPGWPYWRIVAVRGRRFPRHTHRAPVQVTARWGRASVPAPVKDATLIIAAESYKLREAPFGVAGFGEFGVVRVTTNQVAMRKLQPYVRDPILVA